MKDNNQNFLDKVNEDEMHNHEAHLLAELDKEGRRYNKEEKIIYAGASEEAFSIHVASLRSLFNYKIQLEIE